MEFQRPSSIEADHVLAMAQRLENLPGSGLSFIQQLCGYQAPDIGES
jgi:hypothetical protein